MVVAVVLVVAVGTVVVVRAFAISVTAAMVVPASMIVLAVTVGVMVMTVMVMAVMVVPAVRLVRRMPVAARIRAALGLECALLLADDEVHRAQHAGEHVVGFELQVIRRDLDRDVAVAEVVRGSREVPRRAVLGTGANDEQRLRRSDDADQRAVLGDEHVAAANDGAARQEHAERAVGAVGGVEAALAAHVPVELDAARALEQRRREAATLRDEFVDREHGWPRLRKRASITFVITSPRPAMTALKLTQIGNSVGVILPKEVLARLKVEKGDALFVTDAANGVLLTPYDPTLDEQLAAGREFMHEYRDTFHQLAK